MATLHLRERDLHAEVCARSHEMIAGGNARERDGLMMGVLDLEALKMRCGVEPFQLQESGFDQTTANCAQVFSLKMLDEILKFCKHFGCVDRPCRVKCYFLKKLPLL